MQKQVSVQDNPRLTQKQLLRHPDFLCWHVVSSRRLLGAAAFVIQQDCKIPLVFSRPFPSGEGRCGLATKAFLEMKAW